jgi:hypothetical protein
MAEKVLAENPNLDSIVIPLLQVEIQRMEENSKLMKKGLTGKNSGQATCAARKCGFPNSTVNLGNVGV